MKMVIKWKPSWMMAVLLVWMSGHAPLAVATSAHAPVDVHALSGNHLKKAGTTALELEFKTTRGKQTLDVMYTVDEGDKGLALESSDKVKLLTQENGIVKDTVQLRAIRPGRFYLNVFITMNNQSHIVSIPVQIGPEMQTMQRSSMGVQSVDSKGQAIEILPAQETSRQRMHFGRRVVRQRRCPKIMCRASAPLIGGKHSSIVSAAFFSNETPTTQTYTLALHDALPI